MNRETNVDLCPTGIVGSAPIEAASERPSRGAVRRLNADLQRRELSIRQFVVRRLYLWEWPASRGITALARRVTFSARVARSVEKRVDRNDSRSLT
jgi:hypothetical protein